jgi:16S rRNA (uracil1498-N3)-methyltransferase
LSKYINRNEKIFKINIERKVKRCYNRPIRKKEKNMPKFFVKSNQVENEKITIINDDVKHIKKVLRKNVGDTIEICNKDDSNNFLCEIIELNKDNIICEIKEKISIQSESKIYINIFQGLPKSDKMEYIIQKCVELGVSEITPLKMKRCVVKIDSKDENKKIERWNKISEVASKQCGRNIIPKINNITNVKNICNLCKDYDIVLVAYEEEKNNKLKTALAKLHDKYNNQNQIKIAVVIGPEGGIDKEEIEILKEESNTEIITLGDRILRTETVALNVSSIIMYEFEE